MKLHIDKPQMFYSLSFFILGFAIVWILSSFWLALGIGFMVYGLVVGSQK